MRFVFSKTAVVEGQAFEAGTEILETDLRADNFESLRRVGVLLPCVVLTGPCCQDDGEPPPANPETPTGPVPPAGDAGTKPKAEKKAAKKPENK